MQREAASAQQEAEGEVGQTPWAGVAGAPGLPAGAAEAVPARGHPESDRGRARREAGPLEWGRVPGEEGPASRRCESSINSRRGDPRHAVSHLGAACGCGSCCVRGGGGVGAAAARGDVACGGAGAAFGLCRRASTNAHNTECGMTDR